MATNNKAIHHETVLPEIFGHLGKTHVIMAELGLNPKLAHLIELRISQINQCAFCVKMHSKEARDDGETDARLDRLAVWHQVRDFSDGEKAVLAWAEALTYLDRKEDYASLRQDLRAHYSDKEISLVTAAVSMINLWNRVQISKH